MRAIVLAAALVAPSLFLSTFAHAETESDPMTLMKNTVNRAVEVLNERHTPASVRRRKLVVYHVLLH